MKVLHLCGGNSGGGAAKGAINLHRSLIKQGVDSRILFSIGGGEAPSHNEAPFFKNSIVDLIAKKVIPRIESLTIRIVSGRKVWPFSLGTVGYPFLTRHRWFKEADVVHLHWINAGFVSIRQIHNFKKNVVWTLRDEWAYTGGCHYTGECDRFLSSCGCCPLLGSEDVNDLSSFVLRRKRRLQKRKISYVAISEWIKDRAKQSALLENESVEVVLNGIDDSFFETEGLSTEVCRNEYGFRSDEVILLCGATDLDSPFKGYSVLRKFSVMQSIKLRVVTFGKISMELKSKIRIPATHLGSIKNIEKLKELYAASDVFLGPSRMEAFGKTFAEASACGLPLVAYDYGGPRDIVDHSVTGVLVAPFDEDKFVEAAIGLCRNKKEREKMGEAAKLRARQKFAPGRLAQQYIKIYENSFK